MMRVVPATEPSDFAAKVRAPGSAFLSMTPNPRSTDWNNHQYWRDSTEDMLQAYAYVCAYSGAQTYRSTRHGSTSLTDSSIDHYLPKSKYPEYAYEWSNYRLARARLNNRKADHEDVLDPFALKDRWFILDFRSFLLHPNSRLKAEQRNSVNATIARLGLNSDDDYVNERSSVVQRYCQGSLSLTTMERYWPYVASEMRAQQFDTQIRPNLPQSFLSLPTT